MAVPRKKTSRMKKGQRQSHDALTRPAYVEDKESGERRRPLLHAVARGDLGRAGRRHARAARLVREPGRGLRDQVVGAEHVQVHARGEEVGEAVADLLRQHQGAAAHALEDAVGRHREMQAVTAACMLVRREAFEAAGGFHEGYRNGFEDVDLCLQIRGQGGRVVYQPASELVHLQSQTPGRREHEARAARTSGAAAPPCSGDGPRAPGRRSTRPCRRRPTTTRRWTGCCRWGWRRSAGRRWPRS